ncbi:thioredoxin family protein [Spirosoma validum]|uniref:Thioredoxin family protein n=1 Tax=Spirosoma validum TaxID=2771355 RepID=A0A927B7Y0_9BACT|nr:thioredoxin family protein [Spirosoma validum]MBD2756933.1 thioredoxin family protein [Spirosoma validum]
MIPYSSLMTSALQAPVLLVFTAATPTQRSEVEQLLDKAQSVLNPSLQIIRVSETTHPEVVRSFGITALPAFVLLLRGQELWRYAGPVDNPQLFHQLDSQMLKTSPKTR